MAWIFWIKAVSSRRLAATISNDRITSHSATLLSNQSVSMAFYSQHSISRNQQKLWQLRHKTEGQFLFMVNDSNGIVRTKNFSSQPFLIDYAAAHKIQRALLYYRSIACFCPGSSLSKKHFVFVSSSLFFKGRWHDIRSRQKMNHLRLTAVSLECYFDLLLSHRNGRTTLPPCLRNTSKLTELYKTTSPDVVLSHVALTYGYTNKDKFAEVPPNKRVPLTYEQLLKLPGFEMRPMLTKLKNRGFNLNELHKANFLSITSSETHKAKFEAITDGGFVDLGQIKERTSCEWNNNYRNELILRVFPEKFKDETPPGDAFHWTSGDSARPMGKHYTHL